jgi:hypothetical protein
MCGITRIVGALLSIYRPLDGGEGGGLPEVHGLSKLKDE